MGVSHREVLDFEGAAAFLGVSTKTFAKVIRAENLPGRKVGREWKFSKAALIKWLGSGQTQSYQDDESETAAELDTKNLSAAAPSQKSHLLQKPGGAPPRRVQNIQIESFSADED